METEKQQVNLLKTGVTRHLIITVVPFLLIFIVGVSYATYKENQQLTNQFKGALSGEVGDSEYSAVLNQVFSYYKEQSGLQFPYLHQLDNSNFLEADSFKSKDSIKQMTGLLTNALTELDANDEKMAKVIQGAKLVIQNSQLSQNQKAEMIVGFDKSFSDQESRTLSKNRILAMRNFYEKTLSLYEFMLANFDDYKIETDSTGNYQPAFYSETNITRYNQISSDVQNLSAKFQTANDAFIAHTNKGFSGEGIDINASDVQNYFEKP